MSEIPEPDEEAILDRMTDAFFAVNAERRFTYLNERGREVVCDAMGKDLTIGELRGRHIWKEIPETTETQFYELAEQALETQQPVIFEEYFEPLEKWFEVRAYPSESGLSVYFRDITDLKRHERQLKRQVQQLEGFGDILSHDLKNPLNVAMGRVSQARETGEMEHLEIIEQSLLRIETIIDDITSIMEEGALVNDISPVELKPVVRSVWQTTDTADATLVFDGTATIQADESALTRLLENLVQNAVKHGNDDMRIRVGSRPNGFFIEDNGPGIPAEYRDDIFEPQYTSSKDGTGFGLVSVRQIALAHGWDITVTEGDAGGARFEFTDIEERDSTASERF